MTPTLQMWKLRLRKRRCLVQGHPASGRARSPESKFSASCVSGIRARYPEGGLGAETRGGRLKGWDGLSPESQCPPQGGAQPCQLCPAQPRLRV